MADFQTHCDDCERLLGRRYEEVHQWLDDLFRKFGPRHRKYRHHDKGVHYVHERFGGAAWMAAVVHIVRDCGYVPEEIDYYRSSPVFELPQPSGRVVPAPEQLLYDSDDMTARAKFASAVCGELERLSRVVNIQPKLNK